jgi:hypothetical protein
VASPLSCYRGMRRGGGSIAGQDAAALAAGIGEAVA